MNRFRHSPPSGSVLIVAGGTGGHVFPALAVAQELLARGAAVVWLGTRSGLEARVVPDRGIPVEWIAVSGLRGKGLARRLAAPLMLALAAWQALRALMRHRPSVVLGMGGFVSGPGGLMARVLGRPLCIHEQNAVAGLTNRILARVADRVLQAFPDSFPAARDVRLVGNPVRVDIAALPEPDQRLRGREGPLHLLVLGGSQGARALNEVVPAALAQLGLEQRPRVRHQAGERHLDMTRRAYERAGVEAEISAFVEDMAESYSWADLVVCRSGALTVAELAAAGVGAILVPYPYAVDDHQTHNAGYLVDGGAAVLVSQQQLTPERLAGLLQDLGGREDRLLEMARAARRLAMPRAAADVADACLELAAAGAQEERP
ncbi:MAG: undecaprenyldiphospho-muramoylpentapeptide beta-N-acetylglucosaminyltransferase [Gammaproteobacteria bacterium]|nr:undecaprenyldiphospho-muramoylpentapeptide beta-N-acetylglucosaminyltransferase [Gammaproteobacteria bacterium]NIR98319.1 undecaprenyldiphospho-muramoylpentapeptide beta-N-acetylglucosaminyltransferase [Gammaproteobacteria bacterium]NIT64066.1 undecaprenyldiphospho-muramoylpentapeptide beta-N-acetylglucosaminyltransferase [Gammaproteobacteria bacterium]NIV20997.1 undecaprenyldiphospho-muramoylpentapeptide beta-N-acetylglucosaminyltransferase [Gammaproteobacteria bacterium]NIX10394.1 undecapr